MAEYELNLWVCVHITKSSIHKSSSVHSLFWVSEWVIVQRQVSTFQLIIARRSCISFMWWWWWWPIYTWSSRLRVFYSSLKQQCTVRNVDPFGHIILIISQPISVLMLRTWRRSNKYQFQSLCFDLTRARTQDYRTRGKHNDYHTTHSVFSISMNLILQHLHLTVRYSRQRRNQNNGEI